MTVRQLVGDCRVMLAALEPESVQACITSPPYHGLRDYGTPPLVWGGIPEHAHEWDTAVTKRRGNLNEGFNHRWNPNWAEGGAQVKARPLELVQGSVCACGAWLGSLGLEPTPEFFIEHLAEVFREVRRVLRPDGCAFVNLGDSYCDKDLMMMPARVAMALQADGWWLRSMIPWLKRNSMPESVTDRPATSVEYVFLLSKSARYFWDADAVRTAHSDPRVINGEFKGSGVNVDGYAGRKKDGLARETFAMRDRQYNPAGRNRRNSDWFFESWQGLMTQSTVCTRSDCESDRKETGECHCSVYGDDPLALVINPTPFTGAHFATFPPKLVEPMIKASTRPDDVVLDPFGGAGTVGLVADRLGRDAVLIDLKPDYADMAARRIVGDAPLFVEMESA